MKNTIVSILRYSDPGDEDFTISRLKQEAKKKKNVIIDEIFIESASLEVTNKGTVSLRYQTDENDGFKPLITLLSNRKIRGKPSTQTNPKSGKLIPDVIITKLPATAPSHGMVVLGYFSQSFEDKVLNRIDGVAVSRDKFRSLQVLATKGFVVPRSVLLGSKVDLKWSIEELGGFPVIMKVHKGTHGMGVMRVDSMGSAQSVYDTLYHSLKQKIIIQECLKTEEEGTDYRIYVVGKEVVASMKRVSQQPDEFRANVSLGAKGVKFDPPKALRDESIRIARIMNLDIAGIDFIKTVDGEFIPIEVNSSPGIKGLEKATGINVAEKILDFALLRARS